MQTLLLLATAAFATPPSTTLHGERGEISWTVAENNERDGLTLTGTGPGWTVRHESDEALNPRKTVRTNSTGETVSIDYYAWGARLSAGKQSTRYVRSDLWDADTIDLRLAWFADSGEAVLDFRAIDLADGHVYRFRARRAGEVLCLGTMCDRVKLSVLGVPASTLTEWEFQYAPDGRLVLIKGPTGSFGAAAPVLPTATATAAAPVPAPATAPAQAPAPAPAPVPAPAPTWAEPAVPLPAEN